MENTINIGGGSHVPPENTKIIRGNGKISQSLQYEKKWTDEGRTNT